jgi:hypothetical protein
VGFVCTDPHFNGGFDGLRVHDPPELAGPNGAEGDYAGVDEEVRGAHRGRALFGAEPGAGLEGDLALRNHRAGRPAIRPQSNAAAAHQAALDLGAAAEHHLLITSSHHQPLRPSL